MRLSTKIKLPLILLLGLLFSVNVKAQVTFTFSPPTTDSSDRAYISAGVGTFYKSTGRSTISTGSTSCNGNSVSVQTGGSLFVFKTDVDIVGLIVYGSGSGSNRTFSSITTSTSIGGSYSAVGSASSADKMEVQDACDSILITAGTTIPAGTFMQIKFSGNINITSIVLLTAGSLNAPTIITSSPSSVTFNAAVGGGNVTSNGNIGITSRGILYGTSANPQLNDGVSIQITDPATSVGAFTAALANLNPSTLYHIQAYATNPVGTSYGGDSTFTTSAATPTLVSNPVSLGFGTNSVDSSSMQGFSISGSYLTSDGSVTLTAPTGYLLSLNSTGPFTSSVQIGYNGIVLNSTQVFVQFIPTTATNFSGNITASANSGEAVINIPVTGDGTTASLGVTKGLSNVGNDFWTGFGASEKMFNGINPSNNNAPNPNAGAATAGGINGSGDPSSNPDILFTFNNPTTVTANVTIAIPGIAGFTPIQYAVPAGGQFTTPGFIIPQSGAMDARLDSEGVSNNGIHITADTDIVIFQHAYTKQVYAASLLLPTQTLGKQYTSLNYTQLSNSTVGRSYCFGVATDTGTTVIQVTLPAGVSTQTHAAGSTFTDTLQQGQVLNLFGESVGGGTTGIDLTGVTFKAFGTDGASCKKLAFFSGSSKIGIGCTGSAPSTADNLFQQVFPNQVWGYKYVAVPTSSMPVNKFRILINDPATNVAVDGGAVPITLDAATGTFYEFTNSDKNPHIITSDKPVMVAEYIANPSQCGNPSGNGDADMVYLSSIQQGINSVSVVASAGFGGDAITNNFINVAIKTNIANSFKLDGVPSGAAFIPVAYDPTYSYAQFPVAVGTHTLSSSDSGFVATAYGFAGAVSYAYNAGTNLQDLVHRSVSQNTLGSAGTSALPCRNAPFTLSVTLPYNNPAYVIWDFSKNPLLNPNKSDTIKNPVPVDSLLNTDGTKLYVFKDTVAHTYNVIGSFNFNLIAQDPTADGCASQSISFKQQIERGPVADFTFPTQTGCSGTVQFTDASDGKGGTLNRWVWNYGDGTTVSTDSTVQNPSHPYLPGGPYTVKLRVLTKEGCYADTSKQINFTAVVKSNVGPDTTLCAGSSFTLPLTDRNNIAGTWDKAFDKANSGRYIFTPTNGTCATNDTLNVTITQPLALTFNTPASLCAGTSFTLPATSTNTGNNISVTWVPATFDNTTAGPASYSYTPAAGTCAATGTVSITVVPVPQITTISATPSNATPNSDVILTGAATNADAATYTWTAPGGFTATGATVTATPSATTVYTLVAAVGTCSSDSTVTVTIASLLPCLSPMKAFTPNGDGANEVWQVYDKGGCITTAVVSVYNRWGGLVYHNDDYKNNWDGTYKGSKLPDGTYYYTVEAKLPGNNYTTSLTGNVTIIR